MTRLGSLATACLMGVVSLACGGADAPSPQDSPAAPEGFSGRAPAAVQGVPSVVLLRPIDGDAAAPPTEPAVLDQLSLTFMPKELVVRAGQMVRFTNSESLAHNVHVWWMENDSSIYFADMDPGDSYELLLEREGPYDITCDEHPGMRAVLYVTSAPYAAFAGPDGSFAVPDVRPGGYLVQVWNAATGLGSERRVEVTGAGVELDLTGGQ